MFATFFPRPQLIIFFIGAVDLGVMMVSVLPVLLRPSKEGGVAREKPTFKLVLVSTAGSSYTLLLDSRCSAVGRSELLRPLPRTSDSLLTKLNLSYSGSPLIDARLLAAIIASSSISRFARSWIFCCCSGPTRASTRARASCLRSRKRAKKPEITKRAGTNANAVW